MRQVTGSNNPIVPNMVSIQLPLDGHSFSVATAAPHIDAGVKSCTIELLTAATVLVPADQFDVERAAALLTDSGIALAADDCVVNSNLEAEQVAVMAIRSADLQTLNEHYGTEIRFSSPLLGAPTRLDHTVWVHAAGELLYIKVYTGGSLCFAEVAALPSPADAQYLFERLNDLFRLKEYRLQLGGRYDRPLRKFLETRFKEVICE